VCVCVDSGTKQQRKAESQIQTGQCALSWLVSEAEIIKFNNQIRKRIFFFSYNKCFRERKREREN
jgi:hypothetical protein